MKLRQKIADLFSINEDKLTPFDHQVANMMRLNPLGVHIEYGGTPINKKLWVTIDSIPGEFVGSPSGRGFRYSRADRHLSWRGAMRFGAIVREMRVSAVEPNAKPRAGNPTTAPEYPSAAAARANLMKHMKPNTVFDGTLQRMQLLAAEEMYRRSLDASALVQIANIAPLTATQVADAAQKIADSNKLRDEAMARAYDHALNPPVVVNPDAEPRELGLLSSLQPDGKVWLDRS